MWGWTTYNTHIRAHTHTHNPLQGATTQSGLIKFRVSQCTIEYDRPGESSPELDSIVARLTFRQPFISQGDYCPVYLRVLIPY